MDSFDDLSLWKPFHGPKSSVVIASDLEIKTEGVSALRQEFRVADWGGIGFEFTDKPAWNAKQSLSFSIKGDGTPFQLGVEITDNNGERFQKILSIASSDWATQRIMLSDFKRRKDWQPGGAPDDGLTLTQVEGLSFSIAGKGAGVMFLDDLRLVVN
jgi:hypothetical protein